MADIRCSHCGRDNPDFLDVCQFCQSPLKPESMLHIGEKPTKKNTGELETVLPDWLKDARKQARDSAEEDAVHAAAQPKARKDEPPDLLAGLAFQSATSDEEEVPDWLSAINPTPKAKPAAPTAPAKPEPETDFFAQFNQSHPAQADQTPPAGAPVASSQDTPERDELSAWFTQASEQTPEPFATQPDSSQTPADWGIGGQSSLYAEQTPAPKEEEDLSWLHNLEAAAKQTDELKAPKAEPNWEREFSVPSQSSNQEDLSWLDNLGAIPAAEEQAPAPSKPQEEKEDLRWLDALGGTSSAVTPESKREDLSWLDNLGAPAVEQPASQPASPKEDLNWLNSFAETPATPQPSVSQPSDSEDLDWLNNLGGTPFEQQASPSAIPQEDLNWPNPVAETPMASQPAAPTESSQEDLSWLDNLGGIPSADEPSKQQDDLSWLNAFSQAPEPEQPASPQPSAQDDMSWLNAFSQTPESSQPSSPQPSTQNDLDWLSNLQGEPETLSSAPFAEPTEAETSETTDVSHVSPFVPRKTAPLDQDMEASIPDWLKSATEEPSMPMNAGALDQFREDYKIPTAPEEPFSWKSFTQGTKATDDQPPAAKPEPAFVDPSLFTPQSESSIPSAEDVNSLFSMEMPDWMSQAEPAKEEPSQQIGIHAEGGEALAPVDLPSWVQAMRPMDAVISEAVPSVDSQPTEREGPLAGLRGVIPAVPAGSARRPKPISLKLQTTDEQQTGATILEGLLAGETSPRPLVSTPAVASQRALRWVLTGLFFLVLSAMIFLRSQMFVPPVPVPVDVNEVGNVIQGIPDNSNVLVVLDYEPALAGEMEAVSGSLLYQLALLRHSRFSFVATSPNGPALVERLMSNTSINTSSSVDPDGLNYTIDQQYSNLGFLPGAESGVLAFVRSPNQAVPSANVNGFSDYASVVVLTDNAASARVWVEQLQSAKQSGFVPANQPLLLASSAQAGPLLQPYVASRQINGLIAGLSDSSRFEYMNGSRPGIARSYSDAFSVGLIMAVALIFLGSLWSLFAGIRTRRAEAAEG